MADKDIQYDVESIVTTTYAVTEHVTESNGSGSVRSIAEFHDRTEAMEYAQFLNVTKE